MNEKDRNGNYPLLTAISYNNIEVVKLLIEYANQHQIILKYENECIEDKPEIKKLLENNKNKKVNE